VRQYDPARDGKDPAAFVRSKNDGRRHYTAAQKRKLLGESIKANPGKSYRQHAAAHLGLVGFERVALRPRSGEQHERVAHTVLADIGDQQVKVLAGHSRSVPRAGVVGKPLHQTSAWFPHLAGRPTLPGDVLERSNAGRLVRPSRSI
jgi:hypothetical protein